MIKIRPYLLLPTLFSLLVAGQAQAAGCAPVLGVYPVNIENPLTPDQILRSQSVQLAEILRINDSDEHIIVTGQFSLNSSANFLHDKQFDDIRELYWPPTDDAVMPYRIEYSYRGAYSFEGHELAGATLVPFSADLVDVAIGIFEEYEGSISILPSTEAQVIGHLRRNGKSPGEYEVVTGACYIYEKIDPDQLSDLLQCYADGQ